MAETIKFRLELPVSPERVYRAWLDSSEHSKFTGAPAKIDPQPGGDFRSLDGRFTGKTLVATPFSHIVQTWREASGEGEPETRVDILLDPTCLGAQLTLEQTGIPEGGSRHTLEVWENQYFRPLLAYFDEIVGGSAADMDG